jgi:hypothetical protein
MTKYSLEKVWSYSVIIELSHLKFSYVQLHNQEVIEPVKLDSISENHRKKALPYLMFLKQKRRWLKSEDI